MPAYTKSYPVWKDDPDHTTPITAAKLDNMDGGIDTAHAAIDTHAAASPAHAASAIAVTPTGGIAATNAQAALQELQAEIITGAGLLPAAIIDAKGDLIAGSAPDAAARLPVGLVGQVLISDPTQPLGMKWSSAIGGGGAIEYENLWNDTEIYSAGDVVYHNGIQYLAVNPSQGDEPAAFTSSSLYVPVDAVTVAGTRLVSTKLLPADTQPAFRIMGDGKHEWGPGGAAAPDTFLFRYAAAPVLATNNQFRIVENNSGFVCSAPAGVPNHLIRSYNYDTDAQPLFRISGMGSLLWGPGGATAPDTSLERLSPTVLKLTEQIRAYGSVVGSAAFSTILATGDTVPRFALYADGAMQWGQGGASSRDVNLYRAAADVLKTDDRFAIGGELVTSLPASPVDGQYAVLTDSLTAPTYTWRFRYNAGSASAHKWEFVGGSPGWSNVETNELVAGTGTWGDPATVGPTFTVPRTGEYYIEWIAVVHSATTNIQVYCGPAIGAASPLTTAVQMIHTIGGLGWNHTISGQWKATNLTAGNVLRLRYQSPNPGDSYWASRRMTVIPVRVS